MKGDIKYANLIAVLKHLYAKIVNTEKMFKCRWFRDVSACRCCVISTTLPNGVIKLYPHARSHGELWHRFEDRNY